MKSIKTQIDCGICGCCCFGDSACAKCNKTEKLVQEVIKETGVDARVEKISDMMQIASYGVLSGSCTFGFIAPILAIITVQEKVVTGILYILLFATGHSLPIVIAGSSTAVVKKMLENSTWNGAGHWFRKIAGSTIALIGIYFIVTPFMS